MHWIYMLRVFNSLLAATLVGVCLVKTRWTKLSFARDSRVGGLCLLNVTIAWGSLQRRHELFKPWLPIVTIGLALCLYGMCKLAPGEEQRYAKR